MPLSQGQRLGAYEILNAIGAGGMGEVYRARDTRLNRDVAIKALPELFANDAERLARFTREAQTLASLNHPNIAQIHGLEESGGVRALVMELVDGEDLFAQIARGARPLDEVVPIAKQIIDIRVTRMGTIIGTAAYMSPEQARGRAVDRRADVWAYGVVLYEMLTGRMAFAGETATDIIAAVVTREPDWTLVPASTPASVRRLLRRCLKKTCASDRHACCSQAAMGLAPPASPPIASPPMVAAFCAVNRCNHRSRWTASTSCWIDSSS